MFVLCIPSRTVTRHKRLSLSTGHLLFICTCTCSLAHSLAVLVSAPLTSSPEIFSITYLPSSKIGHHMAVCTSRTNIVKVTSACLGTARVLIFFPNIIIVLSSDSESYRNDTSPTLAIRQSFAIFADCPAQVTVLCCFDVHTIPNFC